MNRNFVIKPLTLIALLMLCWSPQLLAQKGGLKSGRSGKSSTKSSSSSSKSSTKSWSSGSSNSSSGSSSGSSWSSGSSSSWSAPSASSASSASSDDDYSNQSYSTGSSYTPSSTPSSTSGSSSSGSSSPTYIYVSSSSDDEPTRYIPPVRTIKVKRKPKAKPKSTTTTTSPKPVKSSASPSLSTTPKSVGTTTGTRSGFDHGSGSSSGTATLTPSDAITPVKLPSVDDDDDLNPEPVHPVVFTSSVLEVLARPNFTKPQSWVFEELNSLEVRPLDPVQPDPPGLPICPITPAPQADLDIQQSGMDREAIACAEAALCRLQELYMLGNWCDPGFLSCFESYLNSLSHCTACLPIYVNRFDYRERLQFYTAELTFWRATCGTADEGSRLRIMRCYLKQKAMMISGVRPEVKRDFEPDRIYMDTAFGIPGGGFNYYDFVADFNPAEVRVRMVDYAIQYPIVTSWQQYDDLDRFFRTFGATDFAASMVEKVNRNLADARASRTYDPGYAYQMAENCAWISEALLLIEPENRDFQDAHKQAITECRMYPRDYERSELYKIQKDRVD